MPVSHIDFKRVGQRLSPCVVRLHVVNIAIFYVHNGEGSDCSASDRPRRGIGILKESPIRLLCYEYFQISHNCVHILRKQHL